MEKGLVEELAELETSESTCLLVGKGTQAYVEM